MASVPEGYYSSNAFADEMLEYLRDRKTTSVEDDGQPFFAYLPFTAPHYPVQCLKTDRDKYSGVYESGPEELRKKRLAKLVENGIINPGVVPHEVFSPENAPWQDLTPKEQKFSARAMECYAGMVHAMDREIGRVLDHLRETNELDNTVVMFFSDNGAEGTALEAEEVVGPWLIEVINVSNLSSKIAQLIYLEVLQ
jgi:arylsulfatase A-like enzyme